MAAAGRSNLSRAGSIKFTEAQGRSSRLDSCADSCLPRVILRSGCGRVSGVRSRICAPGQRGFYDYQSIDRDILDQAQGGPGPAGRIDGRVPAGGAGLCARIDRSCMRRDISADDDCANRSSAAATREHNGCDQRGHDDVEHQPGRGRRGRRRW